MSHSVKRLIAAASMAVVNAGFQDPRTWQVGSEVAFLIFSDKAGHAYALEWGGEDNYVTDISVLKGDPEKHYEGVFGDGPEQPDPSEIWRLDLGIEHFYLPEKANTEETWDHDLRVTPADTVFMLGALTMFLYDLREGKING